ncbi:MAG: HEPN domain-containing protein [Candidatus Manganitrophaceae bacterium]|nr:MAG: HEPN domain-containing protein [Candidatus Manganitrophaceae bacterium]
MPHKEPLYANDWFRIGEKEIRRAEILLNTKDLEGAGFNIQQAVEKYLKGFLLSRGGSLRRIHELDSLLNDTVAYEPSLEEFREARLKITEYYLEERSPSAIPSKLNKQEVAESLKVATKRIEKIRSIVT